MKSSCMDLTLFTNHVKCCIFRQQPEPFSFCVDFDIVSDCIEKDFR